ncbi:MAG: membrane protein insertase YidC [Acidobacteria bacterium]|nr:membrane protein insertase YidC [Acidobacteriota bacterium]
MLLAIVLSSLVLAIFGYFADRQRPPSPPPHPPVVSAPPSESVVPPAQSQVIKPEIVPSPLVQTSAPAARKVHIESPLYQATVSTAGATLTSWKLSKYKSDEQNQPRPSGPDGGDQLEMIPQYLPQDSYRPFFISTGDAILDREINSAPYALRTETPMGNEVWLKAPASISLVYERPGLQVEKSYFFKADTYVVETKPRVVINGKDRLCSLILGPSIGEIAPIAGDPRSIPHAVVRYGSKIDRKPGEKLDKEYHYTDVNDFAGVEVQYFALVFLPVSKQEVRFQKFVYKDTKLPAKEAVTDLVLAIHPVGGSNIAAFLGPKEYDTLHKINPNLAGLIDYGILAPIIIPLLVVLRTTYQFVNNYGVAIIILTLLLTVILFPLRFKQLVSMKRMQKLQPKIKIIQEKYKKLKTSDAQQKQDMQKEIMGVYSKHGVNPLGGCLPMLPQVPIFWAFNNLLSFSIELRKAPFFWWIRDLSVKDPIWVLPILMGLTMVIQQKMTPSTSGDPMQDKMMFLMPVMLTFFFVNLPSGLTLYFLFSNIFGIILQKVSEQWIPSEPKSATVDA